MADELKNAATEIKYGEQLLPIIRKTENSADDAVSEAGAMGRYQILPGTARQYGFNPGRLFDPTYNETVAKHILNDLWQKFPSDPEAVLVGYHSGPGVARRWVDSGKTMPIGPRTMRYLDNGNKFLRVGGQPLPVREPARADYVTAGAPQKADAPAAPGMEQYNKYIDAGFSQQEADQWKAGENQKFIKAGFTPNEIDQYWGNVTPDPSHLDKAVHRNIASVNPDDAPAIAKNPVDQFAAGMQMSVSGLAVRGSLPDKVLPQDAGLGAKVAFGAGQLLGDVPYAVAGFMGGATAGAAAGTAVAPGPGTLIGGVAGGGAGAAMLPQAMREIMMDYYKRGEIHSASDFLGMAGNSVLRTAKVGLAGAVAAPLGFVAGKVVGTMARRVAGAEIAAPGTNAFTAYSVRSPMSNVLGQVADTGVQIGAITTAAAAMEGHLPDKDDFITGTILALGYATGAHLVGGGVKMPGVKSPEVKATTENMENIYRETGLAPWKLAEVVATDRVLKGEVLSQDPQGNPVIPGLRQLTHEPEPFHAPTVEYDPTSKTPEADGISMSNVPVSIGRAHEDFPQLEQAASRALTGGNYTPVRLKDGRSLSLVNLEDEDGTRKIIAYTADGKQVGSLVYDTDVDANGLATNPSANVAEDFRRQGVATAMYDLADKTGGKIPPVEQAGQVRSDDAAAFRAARGKGGKTKFGEVGGTAPLERIGGGRGNGGEPPDDVTPPGPGGQVPRDRRIPQANKLSPEILNEIAGEFIAEPVQPRALLSLSAEYRAVVSELGPARAIDKMLVDKGFDKDRQMGLEDMFRQTYASDARTGYFIEHGALDPITLGPALKQNPETGKMEPVPSLKQSAALVHEKGGNLRDWVNYMVAQRAIDKAKQGYETGHPLDEAQLQDLVNAGHDKYAQASGHVQQLFDAGLEYGRLSGVFNERQIEAMKRDNPMYISFRRVMGDESPGMGHNGGPPLRGRSFKVKEPVSRFEGDDRKISNPLLASVDNLNQIIRMADRNRAIGSAITLAERHGLLEELGLKQVPYSPALKMSIADPGSDIFKPYDVSNPNGETYAPFLSTRAMRGQFNKNQFMYIRNGKPEIWEASDEALATLLRGAESPGEAIAVVRLAQKVAQFQRAGIVNAVDFPLRNVLRDQFQAYILDPLSPPPVLTWIRGAFDILGKGDRYWDWVGKGGAGSALVEMDINRVERSVGEAFENSGTWGKLWNNLSHPLELAQMWSEFTDSAQRAGYKLHAEKLGIDPIKAATGARKAYLDFAEKGVNAFLQNWARVTPFMRPAILGLKQFGEGMVEHPGAVVMKSLKAITMSTAVLYALNWLQDTYGDLPEDQKFKNRPRYEKDGMWILPQIGGVRLRMNYPPILGLVFGGLTTRFLDHMANEHGAEFAEWAHQIVGLPSPTGDGKGAPNPGGDWADAATSQIVPPLIPSLVLPALEHITGHRFYTGHPLIPASLEKASGPMQYTENTTTVAKKLSQWISPLPETRNPDATESAAVQRFGDYRTTQPGGGIDVSPIVIENYVRSYTGTLGMAALKALDIAFKEPGGKPWEMADIPFVGSFLARNPGMNAAAIQEFYRMRDDFNQTQADLSLARKREMAGAGAPGEFDQAIDNQLPASGVNKAADAITNMQAVIVGIYHDKTMNDDEKRQFIDDMYGNMIEISKAQIEVMTEIKKKQ